MELDAFAEEYSSVYPADVIKEIYRAAVSERYSFLYVDAMAHEPRDMFWKRFDTRLVVEDEEK
jgi:hypothetical protein